MFCSCCEFGSSRSPLAAKASILDKEHCARFHCDSAWSNLKASVVTSDLSQMLIVLYCDFSGVRRLANGASAAERSSPRLRRRNPTLRRRKPLLPQRAGGTMPARPTKIPRLRSPRLPRAMPDPPRARRRARLKKPNAARRPPRMKNKACMT